MDVELEQFKTAIKLHEFAASLGYALDQSETSNRETVMRSGEDKISIRRDSDGHYVYYSFRDPGDHGTILDFVISRQAKTFGEARKILRMWVNGSRIEVLRHLVPAPRGDRSAVESAYKAMSELRWHHYLERDRKLPRSVLNSPRFKGLLRVDARANAIFPHYDGSLCGFEKRGRYFKGFADMGEKGLGLSHCFGCDRRLVIAEGFIDVISYETLFGDGTTRYGSIAGGLNAKQPALILDACMAMEPGSEIICITHADADGERYAETVRNAAANASLRFRIHRPAGTKDWNDYLQCA